MVVRGTKRWGHALLAPALTFALWSLTLMPASSGAREPDARPPPQRAKTSVTAIAAGGFHSLILRRDGSVQGWGRNEHHQLGGGGTL